jgi:hypothetical protein
MDGGRFLTLLRSLRTFFEKPLPFPAAYTVNAVTRRPARGRSGLVASGGCAAVMRILPPREVPTATGERRGTAVAT